MYQVTGFFLDPCNLDPYPINIPSTNLQGQTMWADTLRCACTLDATTFWAVYVSVCLHEGLSVLVLGDL